MKRLYATKSLQKDKLYKEIQDNIEYYYKLSIEKEQKQKCFLKRLKVFSSREKNFIGLDYNFEKKYKEYSRLTHQKISTIEQIKDGMGEDGYVSLFFTITLPSSFHPFKSIAYRDNKRLYTKRNEEFAFNSVSEACRDGYKFLNNLFNKMYKRFKYYSKDIKYVRSIEPHTTLLPHMHCLVYVPADKYNEIVSVYKNIVNYYNLSRTDMETVNLRDNLSCASRYILKYIVKTLNDNSDYFEARVLDGWKRANKIRLLTHSQLPLNQEIYKKMYYSITNVRKNRIFSKKDYKLQLAKREIDQIVRTLGISYYYFFQKNLYLEQKIFEADNCSKISSLGDMKSLFHIKIEKVRSRDAKGRLTYKIKRLVIYYRGIEIYQNSKYIILKE